MIRVAVVDDQDVVRAGLRAILGSDPRLEVVAEAGDGLAAVELARDVALDVLVMDVRMPGIDGVEATRRIRVSRSPEQLRIVVLTTFDHDDNVLRALRAGADGFFGKGVGPRELTDGLVGVAAGSYALSSAAVNALAGHVADDAVVVDDPDVARLFEQLTVREREVVAAVVSGADNAEIARRLVVSPFTVKTHVNRAMTKVGARDRAQLVSLAFRAGMRP